MASAAVGWQVGGSAAFALVRATVRVTNEPSLQTAVMQ